MSRIDPYRAFRKFGSQGGRKAAEAMTPEQRVARAKNAAAKMTPEQRSARARKAAEARWAATDDPKG